jgi:hypothetical protein
MQDFVDVVRGPSSLASLHTPSQVLAVIALGKQAVLYPLPLPSANVPRGAEGDAARVKRAVLVVDAEMHLGFQPVVNGPLPERDYIRSGFRSLQEPLHVVLRNVIVVVYKGDVFAASDVHKRLPFRPDAAGAIVEKHKMLNWGASNLL